MTLDELISCLQTIREDNGGDLVCSLLRADHSEEIIGDVQLTLETHDQLSITILGDAQITQLCDEASQEIETNY